MNKEDKKVSEAKNIKIQQATVDVISAENVAAKQISVANMNVGKARIYHAGIGHVKAIDLYMSKSSSGILRAKNVEADRVNTLLCFSDNIEGDVKTVFSKQSAAIFGITFAVVLSMFRIIRRLFR